MSRNLRPFCFSIPLCCLIIIHISMVQLASSVRLSMSMCVDLYILCCCCCSLIGALGNTRSYLLLLTCLNLSLLSAYHTWSIQLASKTVYWLVGNYIWKERTIVITHAGSDWYKPCPSWFMYATTYNIYLLYIPVNAIYWRVRTLYACFGQV